MAPLRILVVACALAVASPAAAEGGAVLRVGYVGTPLVPGLAGATPAARLAAGAVAPDGASGAPFVLARLGRGDATLTRNAAYRGRTGAVDAVAITRYADPAAAFAALQRSRVDAFLGVPAVLYDAARRDARLRTFTPALSGVLAVAFGSCPDPARPCTAPAARRADAVVSEALGLALDRRAIAAALGTPLVRSAGGAPAIAAAGRALARAGWVCPADGLCERGGRPATLTLAAAAGDADAARALPLVVAAGRRAGIDVRAVADGPAPRDGVVTTVAGSRAAASRALALVRRERLDVTRGDTWRGFGATGGGEPLAPGPAALAALRPAALATPAYRGPWLVGLALAVAATLTLAAARRRRLREQRAPRERALPAA